MALSTIYPFTFLFFTLYKAFRDVNRRFSS